MILINNFLILLLVFGPALIVTIILVIYKLLEKYITELKLIKPMYDNNIKILGM